MAKTRPTGERLRFVSSQTGEHILDDYLEAAEKGGRELPDIIEDVWDAGGNLRSDIFQFRVTYSGGQLRLQARVGDFVNPELGWSDVTGLFNARGTFSSGTVYQPLDVIETNDGDVYLNYGKGVVFTSEGALIGSSDTHRIFAVADTLTAASSAQAAAEAARAAAEAAEDGAIAAQAAAELAEADAEAAQGATETAATNAQTAKTASETARDAAQTARIAAELAQANAELAAANAAASEANAAASEAAVNPSNFLPLSGGTMTGILKTADASNGLQFERGGVVWDQGLYAAGSGMSFKVNDVEVARMEASPDAVNSERTILVPKMADFRYVLVSAKASDAEAQEGTSDVRWMTPAKVKARTAQFSVAGGVSTDLNATFDKRLTLTFVATSPMFLGISHLRAFWGTATADTVEAYLRLATTAGGYVTNTVNAVGSWPGGTAPGAATLSSSLATAVLVPGTSYDLDLMVRIRGTAAPIIPYDMNMRGICF